MAIPAPVEFTDVDPKDARIRELEAENEKLKEMLADEIVKAHALSWRLGIFMRDRYEEEE